jgi:hypothetical protein
LSWPAEVEPKVEGAVVAMEVSEEVEAVLFVITLD